MISKSPNLRIAFAGDVALTGSFVQRARPAGAALTYPFDPLADTFHDVDLFVLNLEGPLSTVGLPRQDRTALLSNDEAILDWLAKIPNCVCCLANNHIVDYGAEGLIRTRAQLSERGIPFVGAGLNSAEAEEPLHITVNGMRITILAFTTDERHVGSVIATQASPGCAGLPAERIAAAKVAAAAVDSDAVVVLLHMGFEYFAFPTPAQVNFTRTLVAAGANIVVGHHPHVQQGMEVLGEGLICHSLGNLLLPEVITPTGRLQYRKPATKQFAILKVQLASKRVTSWALQGGRCDKHYRLKPYKGADAERFADHIGRLSTPLSKPEYAEFWAAYYRHRIMELQREGVRDAVAKFVLSPRSMMKTLSAKDIIRNVRRLLGKGQP